MEELRRHKHALEDNIVKLQHRQQELDLLEEIEVMDP